MRNVYIYCLLSVWSIVETKDLSISGHVGGDVSFTCSWDVWTLFGGYEVYLCKNACAGLNKKIIVKAESGETSGSNRITIRNSGKDLQGSITKLQKSDSGTYICGLVRSITSDEYIQVHLDVKDVKKIIPVTAVKKTTPVTTVKKTTTASTLQHPDVSTMTSIISTTTTMLHEPSSSPYSGTGWLVGLAVVLAVTVVALLMFYLKRTSKSQVVILSAINPTDDDGETLEETRAEDQSTETPSLAMSPVYATVNKTNKARLTSIYANVNDYTHQDPTDVTYTTALFESRVTFCVDLHPNQDTKMSQSSLLVPSVDVIPDEDFYSMAQLPKDLKDNSVH